MSVQEIVESEWTEFGHIKALFFKNISAPIKVFGLKVPSTYVLGMYLVHTHVPSVCITRSCDIGLPRSTWLRALRIMLF